MMWNNLGRRLAMKAVFSALAVAVALAAPNDAAACNIGNFVWLDLNGNGIQDVGEPGIPDVRLTLRDAHGNLRTATTDGLGYYYFELEYPYCSEDLTISVDPSTVGQYAPTTRGAGTRDSDSNDPNGTTVNIFRDGLSADGYNDYTIDFGYVPRDLACPTAIGDRVWYDVNLNGIQDPTEPGAPNVRVNLRPAGETTVLQTTYTGDDGTYAFTGLACGTYEVDIVVPDGYALTTVAARGSAEENDSNPNPTTVTPASFGADVDVDFGLVLARPLCPPEGSTGVPNPMGILSWGVDADGNVHVRYDQARGLNDNSYGSTRVQWPRARNFGDLVGSDKARFVFADATGRIVLDATLDYLSRVAGTPSGYASLGAVGGDGRMHVGQAGWILDWDSSLAQNLNAFCDSGLCGAGGVNLLQDSPPTVSGTVYTLPDGSPYEGWNFTNAYQLTISAAAFGASGFGGVGLAEVHNSPPKVGTNAAVPGPCEPEACQVESGAVTTKSRQVKWPIANSGTSALVLSELSIAWPQANGRLMKVKLDGDVVWDTRAAWRPGALLLQEEDLTAGARKKRIDPGRTRMLILEFEKKASANLAGYAVTARFGTGCGLSMPSSPIQPSGNFCTSAAGSGRPRTLTLSYVGENCLTGCNQQGTKAIVTGNPAGAPSVWIAATPTGKSGVLFAGTVALDGTFTLVAADAGLSTLDTNTTVRIYASQGGPLLSTVQFHTSCSQPLNDGDYYGSLWLVGFSR